LRWAAATPPAAERQAHYSPVRLQEDIITRSLDLPSPEPLCAHMEDGNQASRVARLIGLNRPPSHLVASLMTAHAGESAPFGRQPHRRRRGSVLFMDWPTHPRNAAHTCIRGATLVVPHSTMHPKTRLVSGPGEGELNISDSSPPISEWSLEEFLRSHVDEPCSSASLVVQSDLPASPAASEA
jgi:hypothetical protein